MDQSLRFFEYVMKLPGMGTYLTTKPNSKVKPTKVFQYKCITGPAYEHHIDAVNFGTKDFALESSQPRKLLPPLWTKADVKLMKQLAKNPAVIFIVLPCLWEQYFPAKCTLQKGKRTSHMILFIINKSTSSVEIWDDQFANTQVPLYYEKNEESPLLYLGPILETFKLVVDSIGIPTIPAEKYSYIEDILEDDKSFHAIYSSFLANYMRRRVSDTKKPMAQLCKMVPPKMRNKVHAYLSCYDALKRHNDLYSLESNKSRYRNPNIMLPEPCKDKEYRDVFTGKCAPLPDGGIVLPSGKYADKRSKNDNMFFYYYYICLYFLNKYSNLAMIQTKDKRNNFSYYYAMRFVYNPALKGRVRYELNTPPAWDKFMKKAFANDGVRFIAIMLVINGRNDTTHANLIVIDRVNKTVERYEPNAGSKVEERWGNGRELDDALENYFERTFTYTKSAFKYFPPNMTCPRGLHRYEWHERSKNTFDTGGNCGIWSTYMLDLRLANPDVSPANLTQYAASEISKRGSFKHFIDSYGDFVVRTGKMLRKKEIALKQKLKAESTLS